MNTQRRARVARSVSFVAAAVNTSRGGLPAPYAIDDWSSAPSGPYRRTIGAPSQSMQPTAKVGVTYAPSAVMRLGQIIVFLSLSPDSAPGGGLIALAIISGSALISRKDWAKRLAAALISGSSANKAWVVAHPPPPPDEVQV